MAVENPESRLIYLEAEGDATMQRARRGPSALAFKGLIHEPDGQYLVRSHAKPRIKTSQVEKKPAVVGLIGALGLTLWCLFSYTKAVCCSIPTWSILLKAAPHAQFQYSLNSKSALDSNLRHVPFGPADRCGFSAESGSFCKLRVRSSICLF